MKFKKSVIVPIVLSVIGIFVSVIGFIMIQVAAKVAGSSSGPSPLAIIELVLFVLMLSALSAKKPIFAKVVNIISIACVVLQAFIVSIVVSAIFQSHEVTWDSVSILCLGVVCLVASVLFLIYYLVGRKGTLLKIAKITNIFVIAFYAAFAIVMLLSGLIGYLKGNTVYYAAELAILLLNVALLMSIPLALQYSVGEKDEQAE